MEIYVYRAFVQRVIDGDTYVVTIDLEFNLSFNCKIRLLKVNTPEMTGKEKEKGRKSTEFVKDIIEGQYVYLKSANKTDSFGRWLGAIITEDGINLGDWIVEREMGEVMIMSHKKPWWKQLWDRLF